MSKRNWFRKENNLSYLTVEQVNQIIKITESFEYGSLDLVPSYDQLTNDSTLFWGFHIHHILTAMQAAQMTRLDWWSQKIVATTLVALSIHSNSFRMFVPKSLFIELGVPEPDMKHLLKDETFKEIVGYRRYGTLDLWHLQRPLLQHIESPITSFYPPKEGYLYLMLREDKDLVKIGISINPEHRRSQIQYELKQNIMLVSSYKIKGYKFWEKFLHGLFDSSRVEGEWFNLSKSNIAKLNTRLQELEKWGIDMYGTRVSNTFPNLHGNINATCYAAKGKYDHTKEEESWKKYKEIYKENYKVI